MKKKISTIPSTSTVEKSKTVAAQPEKRLTFHALNAYAKSRNTGGISVENIDITRFLAKLDKQKEQKEKASQEIKEVKEDKETNISSTVSAESTEPKRRGRKKSTSTGAIIFPKGKFTIAQVATLNNLNEKEKYKVSNEINRLIKLGENFVKVGTAPKKPGTRGKLEIIWECKKAK